MDNGSEDLDDDSDGYYDGNPEAQSYKTDRKNGVSHAIEDKRKEEKESYLSMPDVPGTRQLLRSATNPISWRVESDIEDLYEPGNGEPVAFLKNWRDIFAAAKSRPQTRIELGGSPNKQTPLRREPVTRNEPRKRPSKQSPAFVELSPSEFETAKRAQLAVVIENTEQARKYDTRLPDADTYDLASSSSTHPHPLSTARDLHGETDHQHFEPPQVSAAPSAIISDSIDSSPRSLSPYLDHGTTMKLQQKKIALTPASNKRKASNLDPDDMARLERPSSRRRHSPPHSPDQLEAKHLHPEGPFIQGR